MFDVIEMKGAFGAYVQGLDLHRPLASNEQAHLIDAFYRHHVLVFRGQHLHPSDFAKFGKFWGAPIPLFDPRQRDPAYPDLTTIVATPDTPEEMRDFALHWHNDNSYDAIPASATLLYGVKAPGTGGETLFADLAAAYDDLSQDLKDCVAPLFGRHVVHARNLLTPGEKKGKSLNNPYSAAAIPVVQPLVIEHPVTGRKCLYGVSGAIMGIVGMEEKEAYELLTELKNHATQPRYTQKAKVDTGGILMWDNFAVMHSATPMDYSGAEGRQRFLYRCSVKGFPALCNVNFTGWGTTRQTA